MKVIRIEIKSSRWNSGIGYVVDPQIVTEAATSPEIVSELLGIDEEAKVAMKALELIEMDELKK